jgi:hypothetical protein
LGLGVGVGKGWVRVKVRVRVWVRVKIRVQSERAPPLPYSKGGDALDVCSCVWAFRTCVVLCCVCAVCGSVSCVA